MPKRFATTLLILAAMLVRGQTTPAPAAPPAAAPAGDGFSFPAIEELERREKLTQLRSQTLLHSQEYQQRLKEINAVFAALGRLPKLVTVEERILAGIEIQRDLVIGLDGLKGDRTRCLGILELVADASRDTTMSAETMRYLKGVRDTATGMLRGQALQTKQLQDAAVTLKTTMAQLPPPATFENHLGLTMVLVNQGKDSFYINRDPIPADKLAMAFAAATVPAPPGPSWFAARHLAQWMSETESALYRLPTVAHLQAYLAQGGKLAGPVWTQSVDEPQDNEERKMRSRFGVALVTAFDPNQTFGPEPVIAEVPFAFYPQMALCVVTPAETGWRFRWNALKQTLDQ